MKIRSLADTPPSHAPPVMLPFFRKGLHHLLLAPGLSLFVDLPPALIFGASRGPRGKYSGFVFPQLFYSRRKNRRPRNRLRPRFPPPRRNLKSPRFHSEKAPIPPIFFPVPGISVKLAQFLRSFSGIVPFLRADFRVTYLPSPMSGVFSTSSFVLRSPA